LLQRRGVVRAAKRGGGRVCYHPALVGAV
jgi:hypothetical protein